MKRQPTCEKDKQRDLPIPPPLGNQSTTKHLYVRGGKLFVKILHRILIELENVMLMEISISGTCFMIKLQQT